MSKKIEKSWKQLLKLCDENKSIINADGDLIILYKSKSGIDYIRALASIFDLVNTNDRPFTIEDVIKQPLKNTFKFVGINDFKLICYLKARQMEILVNINQATLYQWAPEKIIAFDFPSTKEENIFNNALGCTYIISALVNNQEYFIKIGQSRTPFKNRLSSYNCGTVNNWRTASTTNIKMLQSMLATGLVFKLYIYDCNEKIQFNYHGCLSSYFASPKSLAVEEIMLKKFQQQYHQKPLANIQTKPTS